MKNNGLRACACVIIAALMPLTCRADWYAAAEAAQKQDYARAFALYREIAELGHADAQENLAVMYVNGEGVKRDNVLGYAWAAIALENGGGEAAKGIVTQLEPHLNPAARARIAEVQAQFGKAATFIAGVDGALVAEDDVVSRDFSPGVEFCAGAKGEDISEPVFGNRP